MLPTIKEEDEKKGKRAIALAEKINDEKYKTLTNSEKRYIDHFRQERTLNLVKSSEGAWQKIRNSLFK